MKQAFFTLIFLFFTLIGFAFSGQAIESKTTVISSAAAATLPVTPGITDYTDDGVGSPLVFLALTIILAVIIIGIGVSIMFFILGILLIWGMISFGILSISFIVVLHKKSFAAGFKNFVILSSVAGGLIFCVTGTLILNKIMHWFPAQTAVLTGMACGLVAGLALGYWACYVLRWLTSYFKTKLNLS